MKYFRAGRAELQRMLEDADPNAEVTRAGVAKGFLKEQIEDLDKTIEALAREIE